MRIRTSFPIVQNMGRFAQEQINKKGFVEMEVIKKESNRIKQNGSR